MRRGPGTQNAGLLQPQYVAEKPIRPAWQLMNDLPHECLCSARENPVFEIVIPSFLAAPSAPHAIVQVDPSRICYTQATCSTHFQMCKDPAAALLADVEHRLAAAN